MVLRYIVYFSHRIDDGRAKNALVLNLFPRETLLKMEKSKLLTVLPMLEADEMEGFTRYLQVFYERQHVALRVWTYLQSLCPFKEPMELNKEAVFLAIFPEEPVFKYRKLMDALSDLYLWLEEFLLWQLLQKKPAYRQESMLDIYRERKLEDIFFKKLAALRRELAGQEQTDIWKLLSAFMLSYQQYYFLHTDKTALPLHYGQELMDSLDAFYFTAKLKFGGELKNRENIFKEKYHIDFLEETQCWISQANGQVNVLQRGYYLVFQLTLSQDQTIFYELKQFLVHNRWQIAAEDRVQWLNALLNFTATKIKEGQQHYHRESFELHRYGWENGFLFFEKQISPTKFLNIVDLACKLKEYEWVILFIDQASLLLEADHRLSAISLSKALVAFEQEKFDQVLVCLRGVEFKNNFYALRARLLFLCVYYEFNDYSAVEYSIKSFEQFLRRNANLNDDLIKGSKRFCKILTIMISNKNNRKELVKKELNAANYIVYKSWLVNKNIEKKE